MPRDAEGSTKPQMQTRVQVWCGSMVTALMVIMLLHGGVQVLQPTADGSASRLGHVAAGHADHAAESAQAALSHAPRNHDMIPSWQGVTDSPACHAFSTATSQFVVRHRLPAAPGIFHNADDAGALPAARESRGQPSTAQRLASLAIQRC